MSFFAAVQMFIIIVTLLVVTKGFGFVKRYINKGRLLTQLEDKHENLRKRRRDLLQHFYWAESNNERSTADALERQIVELDREIDEVTEQYNLIKGGKDVPLKSM